MRWRMTSNGILALFAVAGLLMVAPCLNASTCTAGLHSHCPLDAVAVAETAKSPHALQCSLVATRESIRSQTWWAPVSNASDRGPVPAENAGTLYDLLPRTPVGVAVVPLRGPQRPVHDVPSPYQRRAPPIDESVL